MSHDKFKIGTIVILLSIMFTLIFAFSNIKTEPNLNANDDTNNNNNPPDFTYINSRSSTINNVLFENNFGGSNSDNLLAVYNLDYYYLIGESKSKDYYFNSNSKDCVFV